MYINILYDIKKEVNFKADFTVKSRKTAFDLDFGNAHSMMCTAKIENATCFPILLRVKIDLTYASQLPD